MKKINYLLVTTLTLTLLTSCSSKVSVSSVSNTSSNDTVCKEDEAILVSYVETTTFDNKEKTTQTATVDISYKYDEDGNPIYYSEDVVKVDGTKEYDETYITYHDDGSMYFEYHGDDDYYIEYDYDAHHNRTRGYYVFGKDDEPSEVNYSYTYDTSGKLIECIEEDIKEKYVYTYDEDGYVITETTYSYVDDEYVLQDSFDRDWNEDHSILTFTYDDGSYSKFYYGKLKSIFSYLDIQRFDENILLRKEDYTPTSEDVIGSTTITDYTYEGCGKTYSYEE